jgi:hypothetical protein
VHRLPGPAGQQPHLLGPFQQPFRYSRRTPHSTASLAHTPPPLAPLPNTTQEAYDATTQKPQHLDGPAIFSGAPPATDGDPEIEIDTPRRSK